jgi:6-phosphogluconate dehydrogenase
MNIKAEWGIVGMGVMGTALSRNFAKKGIKIALFNRRIKQLEEKVAIKKKQLYPELKNAQAFEELNQFVFALEVPRKIIVMISAGNPTEDFLEQLSPLLSRGDIILDGGNSHYLQTEERSKTFIKKGVLFLGVGVSGGEEGALNGPSLMVGGNKSAYEIVKKNLFQIAAKNSKGNSCCAYFGKGGAGHFVKMIHNGIEYAEMQLLAEVVGLLRSNNSYEDIQSLLNQWDKTKSKSYLLKITAELLKYQEDGIPFIDKIQDKASNKGTGAWATDAGIVLNYSNSLMANALYARYISSFKKERVELAKKFNEKKPLFEASFLQIKKSYDLSRWINHHQGFEMLTLAAKKYNWEINLCEVASVWAEGSIIKSDLIEFCITLFETKKSLILSDEFKKLLELGKDNWKETLKLAIESEIPILCMQGAWSYFTALKTEKSTANIIEAQRDYFGAHGFLRIDNKSNTLHHGPWS